MPVVVSASRFPAMLRCDRAVSTSSVLARAVRYVSSSRHRDGRGRAPADGPNGAGRAAVRSRHVLRSGGASWSSRATSPGYAAASAVSTSSAKVSRRVRRCPAGSGGPVLVPSSKANSSTRCMPRVCGRSRVRYAGANGSGAPVRSARRSPSSQPASRRASVRVIRSTLHVWNRRGGVVLPLSWTWTVLRTR